jgi:hypothetical protein
MFLLDTTDCFWYRKIVDKDFDCSYKSKSYQKADKIVDLMTYVAIVTVFYDYFDKYTLNILVAMLLYRFVGVLLFIKTDDKKYLKIFFDGINSTLIVYYLSTVNGTVSKNYNLFLLLGFVIKIIFETVHHKNNN